MSIPHAYGTPRFTGRQQHLTNMEAGISELRLPHEQRRRARGQPTPAAPAPSEGFDSTCLVVGITV